MGQCRRVNKKSIPLTSVDVYIRIEQDRLFLYSSTFAQLHCMYIVSSWVKMWTMPSSWKSRKFSYKSWTSFQKDTRAICKQNRFSIGIWSLYEIISKMKLTRKLFVICEIVSIIFNEVQSIFRNFFARKDHGSTRKNRYDVLMFSVK